MDLHSSIQNFPELLR